MELLWPSSLPLNPCIHSEIPCKWSRQLVCCRTRTQERRDRIAAVGERELRLHAKPYFLSLTFEQPLVGDGDSEEGAAAAASYDVDKGNLTIEVKKVRATALA